MTHRYPIIFLLCSMIALLLTLPLQQSYAANALTEPGLYFLEQEKRKKEQELLEQPNPTLSSPSLDKPDIAPDADAPCVMINDIMLKESRLIEREDVISLILDYVGTCLSMAKIEQLMHDINNHLIAQGYITTRVYITPQDLSTGILTLTVVEGIIDNLVLNSNNDKERQQLLMVMPNLAGKTLQLQDIEQGMAQFNRLRSNNAELKLWPGERPNSSKIVLTNTPYQSLRSYISYDNFGQEATGKDRLRLSIEKDNLLNMSDNFTGYYINSLDTNAFAMSLSIPYGYWTLQYDGSYSEFLSVVSEGAELFGRSYNQSFRLSRLLYQNKQASTSLHLALNKKSSRRHINEIQLTPQSLTIARIGVMQTYRTTHAAWSAEVNYSRGLRGLSATKDPSTIHDSLPHAQFDKLDISLTLYKPLPHYNATLRSSLRGQYSLDALYGSEQISIGDSYTVRGFAGTVAVGDSGFYLQNELSLPLPEAVTNLLPTNWQNIAQPYVFADAGVVDQKASNTDTHYLSGMGGGVRFGKGRVTGDISLAVPVLAHEDIESNGFELYLNTSVQLFPW